MVSRCHYGSADVLQLVLQVLQRVPSLFWPVAPLRVQAFQDIQQLYEAPAEIASCTEKFELASVKNVGRVKLLWSHTHTHTHTYTHRHPHGGVLAQI
jgi:hypothetical protein